MKSQRLETKPPPHGWINELATIIGCDRGTVRRAIYDNSRGIKAEKVRQLYKQKYQNDADSD